MRAVRWVFFDDYDWRMGWVVCCFLLAFAALIAAIIFPVNTIDRHMSAQTCRHWGEANHVPTRFVSYTYWNWDCLTPNPQRPGTWIPTGQIRVVPK